MYIFFQTHSLRFSVTRGLSVHLFSIKVFSEIIENNLLFIKLSSLRMFKKMVLRRTFGRENGEVSGDWRKFHSQ
jgi:hypothetical protein